MTFYQGAILSQRIIANALIEARCVIGGSPAFRKVRGLGGNIRNADIHVSHLSSGGTGVPGALVRARKPTVLGCSARKSASRRRFQHSAEPDIHFAASKLREEPSQKVEFVFSASPETIRREPPECNLLRSVRQPAGSGSLRFVHPVLFGSSFMLPPVRRSSPDMKSRLLPIHGQQI